MIDKPGNRLIDLTGQKFGILTVISRSARYDKGRPYWDCLCECGKIKSIVGANLRSKTTTSCGCKQHEKSTTHKLTSHHLYHIWTSMIGRCENKKNRVFPRYGGRGITICEEWRNNFQVFYDWAISNNWNKNLQIDRKDNDKGYEPLNCRFVTPRENSANRTRKKNSHLPVGVCPTRQGKFSAQYHEKKKKYHLGTFQTPEEARKAYDDFVELRRKF